jgi:hypothetical protein
MKNNLIRIAMVFKVAPSKLLLSVVKKCYLMLKKVKAPSPLPFGEG